jgi:hypothetical protein
VEAEVEEKQEKEEEKKFNTRDYLRETFIDDKYFWIGIAVLLLANIGFH